MVRLIAWMMVGVTVFLSTGWVARLSDKAWAMDLKDATTLGLYAAALAAAACVLALKPL